MTGDFEIKGITLLTIDSVSAGNAEIYTYLTLVDEKFRRLYLHLWVKKINKKHFWRTI
jgi:hypothetical protein